MNISHFISCSILVFFISVSAHARWGGPNQNRYNQPPSISGTPETTATVGQEYTFTPSATDPEGARLTFSVTNLPGWASFNNLTGTLIGTPNAASIGSYDAIVITVSDGTNITSLQPISILVNAASVATGTANLSWEIPVTRSDGSPLSLSEIDGYRIYMGDSISNLTIVTDLLGGRVTNFSFTDLLSGTYFFSVTVYDIHGNESSLSNIVETTIM